MHRIVVITGTPGSGKTTISRMVAKAVSGSVLVSANEIVKKKHVYLYKDKDGALVVDMRKLKVELGRCIKANKRGTVIIEGHLLCDIKLNGAIAIVVREHLATIKGRLEKRRYSIGKIRDNLVSEATDYCGIHSRKNYAKVFEVMNGTSAAKDVVRIVNGGGAGFAKSVDILQELMPIIKKDGRFAI